MGEQVEGSRLWESRSREAGQGGKGKQDMGRGAGQGEGGSGAGLGEQGSGVGVGDKAAGSTG